MRDDLNARAQRRIAVLDPVKLVIDNYPGGRERGVLRAEPSAAARARAARAAVRARAVDRARRLRRERRRRATSACARAPRCGCATGTSCAAPAPTRMPRATSPPSIARTIRRRRAARPAPTRARSRATSTGCPPRTRCRPKCASTIGCSRCRFPARAIRGARARRASAREPAPAHARRSRARTTTMTAATGRAQLPRRPQPGLEARHHRVRRAGARRRRAGGALPVRAARLFRRRSGATTRPGKPVFNRTVTLRDSWAKRVGAADSLALARKRLPPCNSPVAAASR